MRIKETKIKSGYENERCRKKRKRKAKKYMIVYG